jgi:hypothetical protein
LIWFEEWLSIYIYIERDRYLLYELNSTQHFCFLCLCVSFFSLQDVTVLVRQCVFLNVLCNNIVVGVSLVIHVLQCLVAIHWQIFGFLNVFVMMKNTFIICYLWFFYLLFVICYI